MAASLNRVFLMGNLTRDPELRYVPSGTAVATFDLAVNRAYTLPSGEKKEEASFFRIVVWGRRAEVSAEYLTKGSPVFIEGRLRSRSWQTQEGQKRSTVEVVAQNVQFMRSSIRKPDAHRTAAASENQTKENMESIDLNANTSDGIQDKADEIPF